MVTRTRRLVPVLVMILIGGFTSLARAGDMTRLRAEHPLLTEVLDVGTKRSPTFRDLVERIEQSDVIVYLTCQHFKTTSLRGRTQFAVARGSARYVRVDILCYDVFSAVSTIVAHELQHVVEIASAPQVVDEQSMVRLYSQIGYRNCVGERGEQFETAAAEHVGEAVRAELRRPRSSSDQDATHASPETGVRTAPEDAPRSSASVQSPFPRAARRN